MSSVMAESPPASMAESPFPLHLLSSILSRLPVKTLARSLSVCKTWNSLISSPEFMAQHISSTRSESFSLLTLSKLNKFPLDEDPVYDLYSPPFDLENCPRRLQTPPNPVGHGSLPVGVVHGVVCIFRLLLSDPAVVLWNPILDKYISVPMSMDLRVEGFGYDPVAKQLKVLASRSSRDSSEVEFEVATNLDRQWRKLSGVHCDHLGSGKGLAFEHQYFQGYINWLRYDHRWFLLTFDCAEEEFSTLDLPEQLANCKPPKEFVWWPIGSHDSESQELVVSQCGASFAVYHFKGSGSMESELEIWGTEYGGEASSWLKMFVIPLEGSIFDVRVLLEDGKILMWLVGVNSLTVYDLRGVPWQLNYRKTIKCPNLVMSAKIFKESLLLMDAEPCLTR